MAPRLRLELIDVSKRYPGVTANDRVSLQVLPGEIHAVLGEKKRAWQVHVDEDHLRRRATRIGATTPARRRALGARIIGQR